MPGRIRVLHLVGSPVSEHYAALSRLYARDCLANAADPARYENVIAYVEPGGLWRFPTGLGADQVAAAEQYPLPDALGRVSELAPRVALPQMFCRPGMTTYRSLLDALSIPFVGNPADVMALGADKAKARAVVAHAGVDVPPGIVVRAGEMPALAPPVVVKPVDADNSLGISLVRRVDEYPGALASAFEHSDTVLVETYVELGREVRCGVLERAGELVCLPLEEYAVDTERKPVRDHADKIRSEPDGELALVAKDDEHAWTVDPDDPITAAVWSAARASHRALGCRDYSLFDFRIDPDGRPWFLEAGLYNSFAAQSVIVTMAAAAGIPLRDLFDAAISDVLARTERHRRSSW